MEYNKPYLSFEQQADKLIELAYQYKDNKFEIDKIKESQRKQVEAIRDLNVTIQNLQSELEMLKSRIK